MNVEKINRKHAALVALTVAAQNFLLVTAMERDERQPGVGKEITDAVQDGRAHVAISIQLGSGHVRAALALVQPEFVRTLESPEMELYGPLTAVFSDPEAAHVVDLAKLN